MKRIVITGGAICGYCAIDIVGIATSPPERMMMEQTAEKTGRRVKKSIINAERHRHSYCKSCKETRSLFLSYSGFGRAVPEALPIAGIAPRVQEAPTLEAIRGRRPTRRVEDDLQVFLRHRRAIARRPARQDERFNMRVGDPRSRGHAPKPSIERTAEADRDTIEGVHETDGDGQVHNLLLIEHRRDRLEVLVRNGRPRDAGDGLCPAQRSTLALIEHVTDLLPYLSEHQLRRRKALLRQRMGMKIEAVGATVDLRNTQVDQLDQAGVEAALHDVAVEAAECLIAAGATFS